MSTMKPVKFFCEFCGEEVRANDRICPHCGSFFSQVRCQSCGFAGDSRLFLKGCPQCGFQSSPPDSGKPASKGRSQASGLQRIPYDVDELLGHGKGRPPGEKGTPTWVWLAIAGVFVIFMAIAWLVVKG